jgi:hypothetical protein
MGKSWCWCMGVYGCGCMCVWGPGGGYDALAVGLGVGLPLCLKNSVRIDECARKIVCSLETRLHLQWQKISQLVNGSPERASRACVSVSAAKNSK